MIFRSNDRPRRSTAVAIGATIVLVAVVAAGAVLVLTKSSADSAAGQATVEIFKPPPIGPSGVIASAKVDVADTKLQPDPEEKYSFPSPKLAAKHSKAAIPAASATKAPAKGAMSDAEVRATLNKERKNPSVSHPGRVVLLADGTAEAPLNAPQTVQGVVAAANTIANFPYVWGGGHGSFSDSGYDCSGSVSYALAGGSLLPEPLVSGELAHWGEPGPGKWITVYANGGHTFMYVGGLRYDTSGRSGPLGTRWNNAPRTLAGFSVRHWPGL